MRRFLAIFGFVQLINSVLIPVAFAGVFQYRSINFCSWGPGGFDSEKVDEAYGTDADPVGLNAWTHGLWSGSASGLDLIMGLFGSPEKAQTTEFYAMCDNYGIRPY